MQSNDHELRSVLAAAAVLVIALFIVTALLAY